VRIKIQTEPQTATIQTQITPTPISKKYISVGDKLELNHTEFHIISKLGSTSFLCGSIDQSCVVKIIINNLSDSTPSDKFRFCLLFLFKIIVIFHNFNLLLITT
jgi:hypothetical protein